MKKVLLFCILFFGNIIFLNAECSYKELRELNTLASYIDTHYDYNESTGKFDLTILNLPRSLFITYDKNTYNSNGEETIVKDLEPGTQFRGIVVSGSGNNCSGENLRSLAVNIPYINTYYGDSRCKGHENLEACSNRFLDYQISSKTFKSLIDKDTLDKQNKKDEESNVPLEEEKDDSILVKSVKFLQKIYIPLIIVIVTSLVTFGICNVIYRKMKHGI